MGASTFYITAKGKNAAEAFASAVSDAQHYHGHGGYTGTIAEKDEFVEIKLPKGKEVEDYAHELIHKNDARISDKWGPAGCFLIHSEPVVRTEKIPQTAKQTKVTNHPQKGTRKWTTYYVLYHDGKMIDKDEKKTIAIEKARQYSLKNDAKVNIKIEKHLEEGSNIVAEIAPNRPKPKTKRVKEASNTYLFFGWASE